jgi:signal transduction histidine kinase
MKDWITTRMYLGVFCAVLLAAQSVLAQAATTDVPSRPAKELTLVSGRDTDIEEIVDLPNSAWRELANHKDNLGFVDNEVWLRMRIENPNAHRPIQRVIEVPFARMDYIDWYVFRQGKLTRHARSGSMRRKADGALNTRFPALSIRLAPNETIMLYIRIASETVVHTDFRLWNADAYAEAAQNREAHTAFRMGTAFALLCLSYFLVWGFREAGAMWFPLTFTFFGIGLASLAGFWPDVPWMSCHFRVKTLLVICSFWCTSCLLLYARHFYELKRHQPRLARAVFVTALAFFVMGAITVWLPFRPSLLIAHLSVLMAFAITLTISVTMRTSRVSSWLNFFAHLVFFGYVFSHLAYDLGWMLFAQSADLSGFIALSFTILLFILAQVSKVRELNAGYLQAVSQRQAERERHLADQRAMLRDLHDGLGGMAATVSLMAAYGKRSANTAVKNERFAAIERMAGYAGAEIRSMMNTLEQPAPYWADWIHDLREYSESILNASGVTLDWECEGIHPEKWAGFAPALSLMRVLKEAMRNVVKHAHANRVLLRLTFSAEELNILVRDDGHGLGETLSPTGKGLLNMKKRIHELNGRSSIHSTTDGTDINIVITWPTDTRQETA